MMYDVIIVGAGMAGAIVCHRLRGQNILVLEGAKRPLRKVLASGNGRCNLSNVNLSLKCYQTDAPSRLEAILKRYDQKEMVHFCRSLGFVTTVLEGGIYPRTLQAQTVVDRLEKAFSFDKTTLLTQTPVDAVEVHSDTVFVVTPKGRYQAKKLVVTTGSTASIYSHYQTPPDQLLPIAKREFLPALSPLPSRRKYFKALHGVRVMANLRLFVDDICIRESEGVVQLTKEGLSGIAIFQLSAWACEALLQKRRVTVSLSYVSEEERPLLREMLATSDDMEATLSGWLPKKLASTLCYLVCRASDPRENKIERIMTIVSDHRVPITDMPSLQQAQTCRGGYFLRELDDALSPIGMSHVHLAGEVINVDGICGGYNLQWAFASAMTVSDAILSNHRGEVDVSHSQH